MVVVDEVPFISCLGASRGAGSQKEGSLNGGGTLEYSAPLFRDVLGEKAAFGWRSEEDGLE